MVSAHGFYSSLHGTITVPSTDRDVFHCSRNFGLVSAVNRMFLSYRLNDALETIQTEVVVRQLRQDHSSCLERLKKIIKNYFRISFSSIAD